MAVETDYLIPISEITLTTPTKKGFVQTREIPVTIREEEWPLHTVYAYFNRPPVKLAAGGKDIETASQRIRTQIVDRLERCLETTNRSNPPLNAQEELEIIRQFFCLKT